MKTFNLFVVKLEKRLKDTITSDSGLELYIDSKFNDFDNRTTEGPVVCVPFKFDTGVEVGDTLYFHHLVVLGGDNNGQIFTEEDNTYIVTYDPNNAIGNQAIAYKSQKDEDTLLSWLVSIEICRTRGVKASVRPYRDCRPKRNLTY